MSSRWLAASAKRDDSVVLPNADVRETHAVAVGNTDLIDRLEIGMPSVGDENLDDIIADMQRLSSHGKTPVLTAIDGELAGIVAVADTVKPDSAEAIARLKSC